MVFVDVFIDDEELFAGDIALLEVVLGDGHQDFGVLWGEDGFAVLVLQVEGEEEGEYGVVSDDLLSIDGLLGSWAFSSADGALS